MKLPILIPLILYILIVAAIGVWATIDQRRSKAGLKSENYFIGSRRLGPFVLVFTLLASAASAGTFVGVPGLGYRDGHGWVLLFLFQSPAAFITLAILGKKYAILARKHNFLTFTDVLKHRYESKSVTLLASIGIVVFLVAYMTAQYAGGAHILNSVTGVPYPVLIFVFAGIVAVYTAFGGFMAASVNDTAQGVIMLVGGVVLWFAVFITLGGTTPLEKPLAAKFPDLMTLPGASEATLSAFFSYSFEFGLLLFVLPHVAIRAMSYRDTRTAHTAMSVGPIIMAVFTLGFGAMGIAARVFTPDLKKVDLALPTLIVDHMSGPLAGALLAAPLAAIMSTVSSMILVVSGAIVRDVYVNFMKPDLSDHRSASLSTITSFVIGIVVLILSLQPPKALELVVVFAIAGIEAVFTVSLVGGLYWRRANAVGAILSMVSGLVWYVMATQWIPSIAFGFLPVVSAVAVSLILFVAGSYASPAPPRHILVKFWGTQAEIDKLM